MRYSLIILALMILCSCKVHKSVQRSSFSKDGISVVRKDSSYMGLKLAHTDSLVIHGLDIIVSGQTLLYNSDSGYNLQDLIRQAVTSSGNTGKIPSSIIIHVDSLSNKTARKIKKDTVSVQGKKVGKTTIQQKESSKNISKSSIPYEWIGIFIVIAAISFVLYKLKNKLS